MPRLAQLEKMYIGPAQEMDASQYTNSIGNSAMGLVDAGIKIQKTKDTTTAINELGNFKLKMLEDTDKLKVQYADNPEKFKIESENLINKNKDLLLKDTQVSFLSKSEFSRMVDNNILDAKAQAYNDTRVLEVQKAQSDIQNTANTLNTLAYRYGQDGNFTEFEKLQTQEINKIAIAGQNVLSRNQLNDTINKAKQSTYANYFEGQMIKNPEGVIAELNTRKYDNILGADGIQKITKVSNSIIKDREQLIKEETNANNKVYKQQLADINLEANTRIQTRLEEFNIKKNKINNSELNNIESVIEFRNDIRNNNKAISKSSYAKIMSDTGEILNKFIGDNDNLKSSSWVNNTVGEKINKTLDNYFSKNKNININDRLDLFETIFNKASQTGINLYSAKKEDLTAINNLIEQSQKEFIANKYTILKQPTNAVIDNTVFIANDKQASTVGKQIDNGGYVKMQMNGRVAMVKKDSNGKIIDVKLIK